MKKDCRENCVHYKLHAVDERVTVCNHPNGPEIVYPRANPWACTLWKKRSTKLPPADPNDKVFCMDNGHDMTIKQCNICPIRPKCPTIELYDVKHAPIKKVKDS